LEEHRNNKMATSQAQTTTTSQSETKTKSATATPSVTTESKDKVVDKNRVYVGNLSYRTTSEELKAYFLTVCPGVTTAEVISYPNGRSKGCGLVEFKSSSEAERAIKELNNTELGTRKIFIREDREPKGFQGGGGKEKTTVTEKKSSGNTNNNTSTTSQSSSSSSSSSSQSSSAPRYQSSGRGGRGGYNRYNNNNNYQPRGQQSAQRQKNSDASNLYVGNLPYSVGDSDLLELFEAHGDVVKAEVALDRNSRSKGFGTVKMGSADDANNAIAELNESTFQGRKIVVRIDNFAA